MDTADLLTGDRLLNDDGSWAEVVLSEVLAEPLRAYNLTVEGWHTYFVAANVDAAPVWVHNVCGPRLGRTVPDSVISEADRVKNLPGSTAGKSFSYDGGGKVLFEGVPANDGEYQLAIELAMQGKNVVVKGGGQPGFDFVVDGVQVSVKHVTSRNALVKRMIQIGEKTFDGFLDVRKAGMTAHDVETAFNRAIGSKRLNRSLTYTVYTIEGRIRYIPGRGIVHD